MLLKIVCVLTLLKILLLFILAQSQTYHLLLKKFILSTVEKVTVVFNITKYSMFSKSCTW